MDPRIAHKYKIGAKVKASDTYTRFGHGSGEIRIINHFGHISKVGPQGNVTGILFKGELDGINHVLLSYVEGSPPNPFSVTSGIFYWIGSGDVWIREEDVSLIDA